MLKYTLIIFIILSFVSTNILIAKDDLVKMQKKEEKRRKKIKKAVLKITNDNVLRLSRKSSIKVSKLSGSGSVINETETSLSEESNEGNSRDKKYWKSEKENIENSIKFYEKRAKALQLNLNKLSSDYLIIDFPMAKKRIKLDIEKTRAELKKVNAKIPLLKKQLELLYENARKAGVPPGWLR